MTHEPSSTRRGRRDGSSRLLRSALALLVAGLVATAAGAQAGSGQAGSGQAGSGPGGAAQGGAAKPAPAEQARRQATPLQVYAYSLSHRTAESVAQLLNHRLSPRGTLEVQPGSNTLVVRDIPSVIELVRHQIEQIDVPPVPVRLDLRVVRAGPHSVVSPQAASSGLPADLLARLQELLRYERYQVVAEADVASREGESVEYALGERYQVSFRVGELAGNRRLHVEGFRVLERPAGSSAKGRQLEPKELFRADINIWLDRPFMLVLTRDEERKEALLVAITCRREDSVPVAGKVR